MPPLELKPAHKPTQTCYAALRQFYELGITCETAVRSVFPSHSSPIALHRVGRGAGGRSQDEVSLERERVRHRRSSLTCYSINPRFVRATHARRNFICNEFLMPKGILTEAFDYHRGNRCALESVIDQYQWSTDKRNGTTNDPEYAARPLMVLNLCNLPQPITG